MLFFHKVIPFFLLPLGVTVALVLTGVVLRRKWLCLVGVGVLWICAMPVTSDLLIRLVEGGTVRMSADAMPKADVIVVLSSEHIRPPGDTGLSEWKDPDRIFGGIALYQAGKAPFLIFLNGWAPWRSDVAPVGHATMQLAQKLGVPPEHMMTTERVVNTAQEVEAVAKLLKKIKDIAASPTILLVTSAYHMRRSVLLFECADFEVIPFPVDFQVSAGKKWTILDLMPQAGYLWQTEKALHEIYGFLYYYLLG